MQKINSTFKKDDRKNYYIKAVWFGLMVLWMWYFIVSFFVLKNKNLVQNAFEKKSDTCQISWCEATDLKQDKICNDETCFDLEYARTASERQKWLMFRESIPELSWMLFVFDIPWSNKFWMKNTLIVLDMIWMDENFKVIYIEKNVQPCPSALWDQNLCPVYWTTEPSKYVLELNWWMADKYEIISWEVLKKY